MCIEVRTIKCDVLIKKDNLDAAFKCLCELNNQDHLKTYGSDHRPKEDCHFAKLPWNYPETFSGFGVNGILIQLGFETNQIDEGDLRVVSFGNDGYPQKAGDEEHFFDALAPFIESGGVITWIDENQERFQWLFVNGQKLDDSDPDFRFCQF